MRKIIALAISVASLGVASNAMAQSAQQTINLSALVGAYCKLGNADTNGTAAQTSATTVVIGTTAGTVGAVSSGGAQAFTSECNHLATFEMVATPLSDSSQVGVPSTFSNRIGYTATASGAVSLTSTATNVADTDTVAANYVTGSIDIAVTAPTQHNVSASSAGGPLAAGTYSGTLVLKLTPAS